MWYPVAVADPAVEPVSLDLARAHCRIDGYDDDLTLSQSIAAARDYVERYCNVRFAARIGVVFKCDGFEDFEALPDAPVSSITNVSYIDADGATQTLSTNVYEFRGDDLSPSIVLKYNQVWPSIRLGSRISVTVALGYSTAPSAVVSAMLLAIGHYHENREESVIGTIVSDLPMGVSSLLENFRRHRVC